MADSPIPDLQLVAVKFVFTAKQIEAARVWAANQARYFTGDGEILVYAALAGIVSPGVDNIVLSITG